MVTTIDRNKQEALKKELKAQYPALGDKSLNSESLQNLIAEVSMLTHQDEAKVADEIKRKLEYIRSKSI
ncbi:MAG TPA: hypothetical protein VKZ68_09260 [Ohtaekwangia sp.]|nr:hypothetical protein [Ohtaekwangia sp.]